MQPRTLPLRDGRLLVIREASIEDAPALLEYVEAVSGESDFLSFGPGEFGLTRPQEEEFLRYIVNADNELYLVGLVDEVIVSSLTFSAGRRPRIRHAGELGMSVRKELWGQGAGSHILDALLDWARATGIITKINLRVRTDNARAIRLYERKGFVHEGTISREVYVRGEYHAHHHMGLEL